MDKKYKIVLSVAGSDSGGGAGIQADIKTISACGCYAATAITAITAQNTAGVKAVFPLPPEAISSQITAVLEDIGANAIKIGMLHSSPVIKTVKETLAHYRIDNIVLDPVMVATSGDTLLQDEAVETLKSELIPVVRIITPNVPEAEILLGKKIHTQDDMIPMAEELAAITGVSVLLKAGHFNLLEIIDVFYNMENKSILALKSKRIETRNTHGTGCTLSSALASFLAHGLTLNEAVRRAKDYVDNAIQKGAGYSTGKGHGPVHHFYQYWK